MRPSIDELRFHVEGEGSCLDKKCSARMQFSAALDELESLRSLVDKFEVHQLETARRRIAELETDLKTANVERNKAFVHVREIAKQRNEVEDELARVKAEVAEYESGETIRNLRALIASLRTSLESYNTTSETITVNGVNGKSAFPEHYVFETPTGTFLYFPLTK